MVTLLGLAMVIGSFVPSPYYVVTTAPIRSATELVRPAGSVDPSVANTGISYGNVANRPVMWSELPLWWLRQDDSTELLRADGAKASGLRSSSRNEFEEGRRQGMLLAWRLAGRPAPPTRPGVTVVGAAKGSGLAVGDVIVSADGVPVRDIAQLLKIVRRHEVGDRVPLRLASGKPGTMWLFPEPTSRRGWQLSAGLGEPGKWERHPVRDEIALGPIRGEGSSNGLAAVLRAYELLTGTDLTRGRKVVVSGHVDAVGDVQSVYGLPQKARAAADAGADLMIVSNSDVREAGRSLRPSDDLKVVGVDTVDEALTVLERPTAVEVCGKCGADQ